MARNRDIKTKSEQLERVDRDYLQIKRMLVVGLVAVLGLAATLLFTRPGGYVPLVVFLITVEAISFPLFMRSLDKRREQRIAEIESDE